MARSGEHLAPGVRRDTPIVELTGVTKRYAGVPALRDISLTVHGGQCVGLVGPNGAGKTTLLLLINGSLQASAGRVRIFGEDPAALGPGALRRLQRRIGTVYQQFQLVNTLKVVHNVNAGHLGRWSLWKALRSLLRPLEPGTAARVLRQVGIAEKLYEPTDRLSGGEQQRVAVARVLVQDPTLILADEPIASLDPERSREVMDLLRDLVRRDGKTAVLSLHDVGFALSHCERLVGLRHGRIQFDLPASEVTPPMIDGLYAIERGAGAPGRRAP